MAEGTIRFTQYLFPNRTAVVKEFQGATEETARMAKELQEAGWQFECECHPQTRMVYADVCCEEGTLENCLEPNGARVPPAITAMVVRAWKRWVEAGRPKPGTVEANVMLASEPGFEKGRSRAD